MRVKLLLALAIASVLLIFSAGTATASDSTCAVPVTSVDGTAVADALQAQAFEATSGAYGYPVLDGLNAETCGCGTDLAAVDLLADSQISSIDACPVDTLSDCGGYCGECPDCTCTDALTTIPGPVVNLACPSVFTESVPVNLVSPVISPSFPTINLAPTATLALPQVNTNLNCFDITCDCGCPPVVDDC